MARYTDAKCRLCRRERTKLYLKGARCFTDKCPMERTKNYPPGMHGRTSTRKLLGYNLQLREKQKVKRYYGMNEKQFKLFFERANRMPGVTGENLLQLLERRLDNVIYRMGFAASRTQARQIVRHGFVAVNGRKVDIPSFIVKVGDEIEIREKGKKSEGFMKLIEEGKRVLNLRNEGIPGWLNVNSDELKGKVVELPKRSDVTLPVEEHLIVELYSK